VESTFRAGFPDRRERAGTRQIEFASTLQSVCNEIESHLMNFGAYTISLILYEVTITKKGRWEVLQCPFRFSHHNIVLNISLGSFYVSNVTL
jgi:hypothetical protein